MQKLPLRLLLSSLLLSTLSGETLQIDTEQSTLYADCHATLHSFTTTAKDFDCEVELNPETLTILAARCSLRFEKLDSEKAKRDKKMNSWMESESYPIAEFTMTSVKPGENPGEQIATGDFSMHGETHPIEIPFTLTREGDQVIIEGSSRIDTRVWGLPKIRMFLFTVDPEVVPHFHLVGTLKKG